MMSQLPSGLPVNQKFVINEEKILPSQKPYIVLRTLCAFLSVKPLVANHLWNDPQKEMFKGKIIYCNAG